MCQYVRIPGMCGEPEMAPDTAPAAAAWPAPAAACTRSPAPPSKTLAAAAACAPTAPAACASEDSFLLQVLGDAVAAFAGDRGKDVVGGGGYEAARARATLEATRLCGWGVGVP